jgi:FG-GAP-like repeat/Bacterial TSP3 repeat
MLRFANGSDFSRRSARLAAGGVALCLLGLAGAASAMDSDGDGLTDDEERARVRTVPFGPQQVITTSALGARAVVAADLDGDGDLDAVAASNSDDTLAWYENRLNEASADFGPEQIIAATMRYAIAVLAADLDGDKDPDVIGASLGGGSSAVDLAWYENSLNKPHGGIGPERAIDVGSGYFNSIAAADLDGDRHLDVLSASAYEVAWYENRLDKKSADFAPKRVIATPQEYAHAVAAADVDGDGDVDVLASITDYTPDGYFRVYKIIWYENRLDEASGDFGPGRVITTAAERARSIVALDLDGDGDPDLLSASDLDGTIAWYENRLNQSSADFGPQQVITSAAAGASVVFAADLDGDGDPDALSASYYDNKLAWYENRLGEPLGGFGPQQLVSSAARGLYAADLDGDGDADVLSTASSGGQVTWYENPGTDPNDPDSDGDGISDGDEVTLHATDPLDPDTDGDGLTDGFDPLAPGEQAQDPDADALDNAGEQAAGTDPRNPDTDGDGLSDGFEVANGFDPLLPGEQLQDPDGDGLDNSMEQAAGTDPLDPDTDRDGLSDGDELNVYATDPLDADTDGDGARDGREVGAGTDPNDPTSRPPGRPAMFHASFIMHAFGNDITTGPSFPSNTSIFIGMPLGHHCARRFTQTPGGATQWYSCGRTTYEQGARRWALARAGRAC